MTKWRVRKLKPQDKLRLWRLKWMMTAQTRPIALKFRDFKRLMKNDVSFCSAQWSDQLLWFGMTMMEDGLKTSSAKTYMLNVLAFYRWIIRPKQYARARYMIKAVDEAGVMESTQTAPGLTRHEAEDLLRKIKDPFLRAAGELILFIPLRVNDLQSLLWKHVEVLSENVSFQLTGGKTQKTRANRERIVAPRSRMSSWLAKYLARGKQVRPATEAVSKCTASDLNKILKDLDPKREPTSYSLRNLLIRELVESTRGTDGVIDWDRAMELTLHRSKKVLKSAYMFPA